MRGWRYRHPSWAWSGSSGALTVWNDQVGLLPWGLARILGITVYLGIPADTAWWAAGVGLAVLGVGLVLALPGGRQRHDQESGAEAVARAAT